MALVAGLVGQEVGGQGVVALRRHLNQRQLATLFLTLTVPAAVLHDDHVGVHVDARRGLPQALVVVLGVIIFFVVDAAVVIAVVHVATAVAAQALRDDGHDGRHEVALLLPHRLDEEDGIVAGLVAHVGHSDVGPMCLRLAMSRKQWHIFTLSHSSDRCCIFLCGFPRILDTKVLMCRITFIF